MKKLFFALISLLLFASNVFADCEILLQKDAQTIELGDTWSKDINEEGYTKVDFMIARSKIWGISTGKVIVYIYDNDGNKLATKEIKNDDIPLKDNYSSYSIESSGTSIRRISIEFPWGGGGKKHVKEVYAKKKPRLAIPTAPINFVNGANEQTINIDYSALTSDLTAELETKDEIITLGSPYGTSTSSVAIAYAGCTNGTVGLKVSYNPTNCNDYTNKIIFKQNGTTVATINVSSTYDRYVRMNTNDINFTDKKPGEESKNVINIYYAYQSEDVIATLENADSPFSLNTAIVAKGDCSVGNTQLTLTYNPTDCNYHTNRIIFTQGGKTIATINVGSTYNRYVNMKTDDISFLPTMELGAQKTISVDVSYAFISENLTATLENADSPFSLSTPTAASASSVIVAKNNCTAGSTTLIITFDPKTTGIYSNVIKLSNGSSINVSGECSATFDTDAANFKVEKASYTSIKLRWNAVPGASGYRIVNQTNGATYTVDANTTSLNATGLKMDTNYSFVFYALFNDNITSLNEATVSATTLKKEGVVIEDCSKFYENYDAKQLTVGVVGYNKPMIYDNISITGNLSSYKVRFRAKMTYGSVVGNPDLCMYVKLAGKDNYENVIYWEGRAAGLDDTYREYLVEIPQNTIAIKFDCDENGATLTRYVDDLYIFRENILEADKTELDFGEVKPNEYKDLSVNLTYSNVAKLESMLDSEYFTIQSFNETAACTDGMQEVVIRFQPTACSPKYEESLTIFNGQELAITLKGKLKTNPGTVKEITWTGEVDTNWDNRANWIKADDNVLSVADVLDEKLKVNIPASLTRYPIIPDVSTEKAFKEDRDKACDCAQVNAGDNATATMIADKIYMESGASLVGVETLNQDVPRYSEVEMEFTARRHDWLLVGPVVMPWDEANPGETRNVESGDYFLYDMPHVYMHKAEANRINNEIEVSWHNSFPSLEVKLNSEEAFAIRVPDQYGRNLDYLGIMKLNKLPAEVYNSLFLKEGDTPYDGNAPHTYTFKGRFYNENSLPTYTLPGNKQPIILSNTYPANIDGQKLQTGLDRTIYYYDDENKSFKVLGTDNKSIMAQHSFVVVSGDDVETIEIKKEWFETSGTEYRNTSATIESFRVEITNNTTSSASDIYVCYDELKDEEANNVLDAPKIFNKMETSLADLYIIGGSKKWSGLVVPTLTEPIALGINVNSADQSFTFSLKKSTLSADVILEDRFTNTKYNLSEGEICLVEGLQAGACEGRFYLLLAEQEVEEDPEISTDVEENLKGGIDIYSQGNSVVVSSSSDIELMQVVVSDIAGRSQVYNVSGQYTQLTLPVNNGVYTISVIGDKATKVEKIKLN